MNTKAIITAGITGTIAIAAICGTQAAAVSTPMTQQQETISKIIELAESLELPDDHPLIVECKKLYHGELQGPELEYVGKYYITGYDTCAKCCGKSDGITASGTHATAGRTIATGAEFDFGTELYIDGIGNRIVEDRGVKNGEIDVCCENHAGCYAVTGWYDVYRVVD